MEWKWGREEMNSEGMEVGGKVGGNVEFHHLSF